jgi:hypothetical protein
MAKYANLQNTGNAADATYNVGSIINKALIGILISKGIITEEEMIVILGKINRQQETYSEQQRAV